MLRRLLLFKFPPTSLDAGLLVLRVIVGASIFAKHGFAKIFHYSAMYQTTAVHQTYVTAIGVGPSLWCAGFADGVCTLCVVLGLFTRWSALCSLISLLVAWGVVGKMAYLSGTEGGHGELIVAYIAAMLTLVLTGGGRFSVDQLLEQKGSPV